jgi:hypothetical protein
MTKTIKTILLLIVIIFSFQLFIPSTLAQEDKSLEFTPQVTIPGESVFQEGSKIPVGVSKTSPNESGRLVTTMYSNLLPRYIQAIYNYGIGIAAFLALAMIVAGGLIWLTSGGSTDKISTARSMIVSAIIGLILLLGTYTLLQIVSPALLSFKPIETEYIGALQIGCCEYEDSSNKQHAETTGSKECEVTGESEENGRKNIGFYADKRPNADSTKCITLGCCSTVDQETIKTNSLANSILGCFPATKNDCNITKYDLTMDMSSEITIDSTWSSNKCSVLDRCSNKDIECNAGDYGEECKVNGEDLYGCYCYAGQPWGFTANSGEPCGTDEEATCKSGSCSEDEKGSSGGRKCDYPDYSCCYYSP